MSHRAQIWHRKTRGFGGENIQYVFFEKFKPLPLWMLLAGRRSKWNPCIVTLCSNHTYKPVWSPSTRCFWLSLKHASCFQVLCVLTELFCSVFIATFLYSTNVTRNTAEGNATCKLWCGTSLTLLTTNITSPAWCNRHSKEVSMKCLRLYFSIYSYHSDNLY